MTSQHRVILDTDIGTDVDDILALGVLLGSTGITLDGITTVYGDVHIRAQIARKVLQLRGCSDIPVHTGISRPLLSRDPIYWLGHEGIGLLTDADTTPDPSPQTAVEFLVRHVREHPGEITMLAIGPLTNVAAAIILDPDFPSNLKRLVVMGGKINTSLNNLGPAEHNIKCDPEAAHVVFSSATNIELVPLDVTLRVLIRQQDVDRLNEVGSPYHTAIADQVARYAGFVSRGGSTFLHDPLAAMAIIEPNLLSWTPFKIQIEVDGMLTRGMTVAVSPEGDRPANARVALDVNVDECEHAIIGRVSN